MSAQPPEALVALFLRSIRNQFYQGHEKLFYQEKNLLMQAICWPARYLDERAVKISAERYKALLTDVIRTIKAKGQLGSVRSPGRYLLHCVQEHMKHQGETYYDAGKATRNAIDDFMMGLKTPKRGAAIPSVDSTVPALAETHRILSAAKGGRRKASAAAIQDDLFNDAKPLQPSRKPRA